MLIIIHEDSKNVVQLIRDKENMAIGDRNLVNEFWRLSMEYPSEIIIWIDKRFEKDLNVDQLPTIFHHDLIIASFAVKEQYFSGTLGYIDQLPFLNPDYKVSYPTWLMSPNIGGIKGETALAFKDLMCMNYSFGYLINAIAKIGQQNSLFCYSDPQLLIKNKVCEKKSYIANTTEHFKFVFQFYKTPWIFILLFCYCKYEKQFPWLSFLKSFLSKKQFKREINLDDNNIISKKFTTGNKESLDVIIPTLKRPEHVKQLLFDLKNQSFHPSRIIIIEQDPDREGFSQLKDLSAVEWPFEIIHHFVNKSGACMARNMALYEVRSKWVFFADDDIRLSANIIEEAISEMYRLGIQALNLNCLQPGESTVFRKVKQWGNFGSGTAIVSAEYALQCKFNEAFEYGFGEDTDFGLQLRSKGADIIYHPELKILHLKAERGGFRVPISPPWEKKTLSPKPSPTMMLLVMNHYSDRMIKGYKVSMFIKFYRKQPVTNPFSYLKIMEKKWDLSKQWSYRIAKVT